MSCDYCKIDCKLFLKSYSPDVTTFTCSVTGLGLRLLGCLAWGVGSALLNLGVLMILVS